MTYELGKSAIVVERRYPTFVDMIAKFGGFSRVITFFIFTFVSLHQFVLMEQYLLNEAILQKKKQTHANMTSITNGKLSSDSKFFSYLEVLKFKFFFMCIRKSQRCQKYEKFQKVIRDRMDAQSLLTNSGNINLLSSTLLKPYQMTLIHALTKTSLKFDLTTRWVSLEEAHHELMENQFLS